MVTCCRGPCRASTGRRNPRTRFSSGATDWSRMAPRWCAPPSLARLLALAGSHVCRACSREPARSHLFLLLAPLGHKNYFLGTLTGAHGSQPCTDVVAMIAALPRLPVPIPRHEIHHGVGQACTRYLECIIVAPKMMAHARPWSARTDGACAPLSIDARTFHAMPAPRHSHAWSLVMHATVCAGALRCSIMG